MLIFVSTDPDQYLTSYHTNNQFEPMLQVVQDSDTIDISKLAAYKVVRQDDGKDHLVFDEDRWAEIDAANKKDEAVKDGNSLFEDLTKQYVLDTASDENAYRMRYLYESWKPDTAYITGDRRLYGDNLYKCKQNHTSEAQHTPDLIPAIWDLISKDGAAGTKDNPIIIPEPFSSMEYVKGKYYKEGDTLYLMNRQGMEDGETISLTYKPSALVGHYFEEVTE